ncbi:MAG TPA: M56 family metallopeptidase [Gemmataceae bacterium]|jgi:beta-lactamase regulating signal transducer with metallopeptidase domain/protocatechuate 3,4-dioxygenase beta subunit
MIELIDTRLTPLLLLLADWSLRWGVVLVVLAAMLKLWPPRRPATRLLLCRLVLLGGLLLPLLPRCWGPSLSHAEREETVATAGHTEMEHLPPATPTIRPRREGPLVEAPPPSPEVEQPSAEPIPEEAAAEPPAPVGRPRWIVPALAGIWMGGVVLMMARLLAAWVCLTRFRRGTAPVDEPAQAFFRRCRTELGVRRRARLMSHPAVDAPVLLGGFRPCIVVPADWQALPEAARRSSLLHELTHLTRRDDWLKLGEEIVRCLFFFHPLVGWLLHRLEGERELLCDAVVVRQGVAPRQLAQVLLDFTKRLGCGRSAVPDGLATSFFHRMTVKDRIHQLLEDDMTAWTAPLSRGRMLALAAGVLAAMAGLGSLGVRDARSVEPAEPPKAPPAAAPALKPAAAPATPTKTLSLEGRLVDVQGKPIAGATIVGMCRTLMCVPLGGPPLVTDKKGRFRLDNAPDGPLNADSIVSLLVKTKDGHSYEVNVVGIVAGEMQLKLPAASAEGLKFPKDVKPGELAGVVVDEAGKPLPDVEVDVWEWHPGNETRTDKDGAFRLKDLGRDSKVQVRFRKAGWSPVMFVQQPVGVSGWVVAMDRKTYFEGVVRGPDGKPAAGASIRADQGPKRMDGGVLTHSWTDTKTDAAGRYRLYVQPDAYEFLVKAPGVGVARLPKKSIAHGTAEALDIKLQKGVTFRAVAVDVETGKPIAGVRLWHWQHRDVEGRSNARGEVEISEMLPSKFDFQVEAAGYVRFWSKEAVSEWNRFQIDNKKLNWQRNFDGLDFDLRPDMAKVKIVLERGARVKGRVIDPDGKPVAGATVAPALTGTGNSLTGDSRFSVPTKADGTFEVLLPASNDAQYNLVAHDGAIFKWRKWGNGVLPPFRTKPGEEIKDMTLTLTRPAVVRGKVVDDQGKPVAYREVRASAADKLENRYYDPTTTTKEDGTFELRFIRPGQQYIQVAPFWLSAEQAPGKTTRKLQLKEGQTVEGVKLIAVEPR